jgi:hypothetical protein
MTRTLKAIAIAAAGVATLALGSLGAFANEPGFHLTYLPENGERTDERAERIVTGLMQPVMPFIEGTAAQTTSILQLGVNSSATSLVEGTGNLSAIVQTGQNNRAAQAIQGHNSAMLLVQGGTNNSVIQSSVGNQNFQLVGVSGENNNVGYVQVGNNLAGALDVTGAQNSNVIALQTNGSSRYLMPSGLRGLSNTTVVIVPGRMYVIPHNRIQ